MSPNDVIVHSRSATLELIYDDITHVLSAEYLRVHSPSAEVQGHSPGQTVLQTGKKHVTFREIEPQGHYALKIEFSDGHDSGIYTWDYLRELGDNQQTYWQAYLDELTKSSKSREPQFIAVDNN